MSFDKVTLWDKNVCNSIIERLIHDTRTSTKCMWRAIPAGDMDGNYSTASKYVLTRRNGIKVMIIRSSGGNFSIHRVKKNNSGKYNILFTFNNFTTPQTRDLEVLFNSAVTNINKYGRSWVAKFLK